MASQLKELFLIILVIGIYIGMALQNSAWAAPLPPKSWICQSQFSHSPMLLADSLLLPKKNQRTESSVLASTSPEKLYSPDGKHLLLYSKKTGVYEIVHLETGELHPEGPFSFGEEIIAAAWTQHGEKLALVGKDTDALSVIEIFSLEDRKSRTLQIAVPHSQELQNYGTYQNAGTLHLEFNPSGNILAIVKDLINTRDQKIREVVHLIDLEKSRHLSVLGSEEGMLTVGLDLPPENRFQSIRWQGSGNSFEVRMTIERSFIRLDRGHFKIRQQLLASAPSFWDGIWNRIREAFQDPPPEGVYILSERGSIRIIAAPFQNIENSRLIIHIEKKVKGKWTSIASGVQHLRSEGLLTQWSPNGRFALIQGMTLIGNDPQVFVFDRETEELKVLGSHIWAYWSSDGKILCVSQAQINAFSEAPPSQREFLANAVIDPKTWTILLSSQEMVQYLGQNSTDGVIYLQENSLKIQRPQD